MKTIEVGGLTTRIVGGTDGQGGGDGPCVVLLHGFGAPGTDLVPLAHVFAAPPGTRFVFPAAPLALPPMFGDGRAWWMIDIEKRLRQLAQGRIEELLNAQPKGLEEANAAVHEVLDFVRDDLRALPEKTVIGGFSQGAMLALDVTLRSDRPFAGMVLMSCTLMCKESWVAGMASRKGLRCVLSHGRSDEILPFFVSEMLRDCLLEAGWNVDWVEFSGGHEIPPPVIRHTADLLSAVLEP